MCTVYNQYIFAYYFNYFMGGEEILTLFTPHETFVVEFAELLKYKNQCLSTPLAYSCPK